LLIVTQGRPTFADFDIAHKKNVPEGDFFSSLWSRPRFFCEKSKDASAPPVCPSPAFPV
jgi:hypothetical protein